MNLNTNILALVGKADKKKMHPAKGKKKEQRERTQV
jgi:hypothetical protein